MAGSGGSTTFDVLSVTSPQRHENTTQYAGDKYAITLANVCWEIIVDARKTMQMATSG